MKLRAFGRYLLVKMDVEKVDEQAAKSTILLPKQTLDKEKGGCQVATVLSIGSGAFDDETEEDRGLIKVGTKVLTSRYPGHEIGVNLRATDAKVNEYRVIGCSEVHAVVDDSGVELET